MPATELLEELAVTFDHDKQGRVLSSLLIYRKGVRVVRSVQPNPSCQIFFLLGADDLLVAIHALENCEGLAVQQIFTRLLEDATGNALGVDRKGTSHFLTPAKIARLASGFQKALDPLPKPAACPV